jgi:hypothetical protein
MAKEFVEIDRNPHDDDFEVPVEDEVVPVEDEEFAPVPPDSESIITSVIQRAKAIRSVVNVEQGKAAEKMEKKHDRKRNKRTLEYALLDHVSVMIPRIDRGGSDLRRLPGIVSRIAGEFYEIKTKYGILNDCVRAGELESYHGILDFDPTSIVNKISLTAAANRAGNRDKNVRDIEISCSCKAGSCSNKLCKCFKNNLKCNSHCHGVSNSNCCNK